MHLEIKHQHQNILKHQQKCNFLKEIPVFAGQQKNSVKVLASEAVFLFLFIFLRYRFTGSTQIPVHISFYNIYVSNSTACLCE